MDYKNDFDITALLQLAEEIRAEFFYSDSDVPFINVGNVQITKLKKSGYDCWIHMADFEPVIRENNISKLEAIAFVAENFWVKNENKTNARVQ